MMAITTIHGKALRPMIGASRGVVGLKMAADTFGRQPLPIKLSDGSCFVARVTIHNRVRAD